MSRPAVVYVVVAATVAVSVLFAVPAASPAAADDTGCQIIEVTVPPHTFGTKVCPPPA
jgi:hypothetical protein